MTDLRKLIARALCAEFHHDNYCMPPSDGYLDRYGDDYLPPADAVLAALDNAGLVVVPREPTKEMLNIVRGNGGTSALAWALAAWPDMIAASPYAKKETTDDQA